MSKWMLLNNFWMEMHEQIRFKIKKWHWKGYLRNAFGAPGIPTLVCGCGENGWHDNGWMDAMSPHYHTKHWMLCGTYRGVCLQICAYSRWYSFILVDGSLAPFAFNRSDNSDTGNHVLPQIMCSSSVSYTNLYWSCGWVMGKVGYLMMIVNRWQFLTEKACRFFTFQIKRLNRENGNKKKWKQMKIDFHSVSKWKKKRLCSSRKIALILCHRNVVNPSDPEPLTTFSIRPFLDCRNFFRKPNTWKQSSSSASSMLASMARYTPERPPPSL